MCLAELVSRQDDRTATGVGPHVPVAGGSLGPDASRHGRDERLEMVEKQIELRNGRKELHDRLAQVRENRYAISAGETISVRARSPSRSSAPTRTCGRR